MDAKDSTENIGDPLGSIWDDLNTSGSSKNYDFQNCDKKVVLNIEWGRNLSKTLGNLNDVSNSFCSESTVSQPSTSSANLHDFDYSDPASFRNPTNIINADKESSVDSNDMEYSESEYGLFSDIIKNESYSLFTDEEEKYVSELSHSFFTDKIKNEENSQRPYHSTRKKFKSYIDEQKTCNSEEFNEPVKEIVSRKRGRGRSRRIGLLPKKVKKQNYGQSVISYCRRKRGSSRKRGAKANSMSNNRCSSSQSSCDKIAQEFLDTVSDQQISTISGRKSVNLPTQDISLGVQTSKHLSLYSDDRNTNPVPLLYFLILTDNSRQAMKKTCTSKDHQVLKPWYSQHCETQTLTVGKFYSSPRTRNVFRLFSSGYPSSSKPYKVEYQFPEHFQNEPLKNIVEDYVKTVVTSIMQKYPITQEISFRNMFEIFYEYMPTRDYIILTKLCKRNSPETYNIKDLISILTHVAFFLIFDEFQNV